MKFFWSYNICDIRIVLLICLVFADVCSASEYCTYNDGAQTVARYCDGYCCQSYDSYNCCTSWGWVAGAAIGGVVFIAIVGVIVFMVCAKIKAKKTRTVNVRVTQASHTPYANNQRQFHKPNRAGAPPAYAQYPVPPPSYNDSMQNTGPYFPPPPSYTETVTTHPQQGASGMQATNIGGSGMQTTHFGGSGMQTTSISGGDPAYPPPPNVA